MYEYILYLLGFLVILCGLTYYKIIFFGHKLPPVYPGALPLIGHTHIVLSWARDLGSFIETWVAFGAKSGGVTCGFFLGTVYYGISDMEDAVTVTNALSYKHPYYRFGEAWLGDGLITASGPIYHTHRKLLNPVFGLTATYGFLDVFNEQTRRLTNIIDGYVGKGPVDPGDAFRNVTLRTSCITIFGAHDEKNDDFINKYVLSINNSIELLRERLLNPLLYNNLIFGFSKVKKRLESEFKVINDIIQEVIEKKKEEMKNVANFGQFESDTLRSFVDILLTFVFDGSLTNKELIDELNTSGLASFETTSSQLVYIASMLGTYPDVQEKIYKEVMEVVGDRDINKHDISKLVYTEAFIKECVRMKPILNALPRFVDKDVKLKNYTLRAGTFVIVFVDGLNKDPCFGPDVNEFRPQRWLDEGKPRDSLLFAFSHGQRSCPGKKYGMVSMKITVAHIVRMFRLKGDCNKIKNKFDIVMRPESGHEVIFERRN